LVCPGLCWQRGSPVGLSPTTWPVAAEQSSSKVGARPQRDLIRKFVYSLCLVSVGFFIFFFFLLFSFGVLGLPGGSEKLDLADPWTLNPEVSCMDIDLGIVSQLTREEWEAGWDLYFGNRFSRVNNFLAGSSTWSDALPPSKAGRVISLPLQDLGGPHSSLFSETLTVQLPLCTSALLVSLPVFLLPKGQSSLPPRTLLTLVGIHKVGSTPRVPLSLLPAFPLGHPILDYKDRSLQEIKHNPKQLWPAIFLPVPLQFEHNMLHD
jgi:hypothetical protein